MTLASISDRSLFVLLCLTLAGAGQPSLDLRPGSILRRVEEAKRQGNPSVTVNAPQGMYEKISSVDAALSKYEVAVGSPSMAVTTLVDDDHLYTWYKVEIKEILMSHPNADVPAVNVPDALRPVAENERVIRIPMGTMMVNGVSVTVKDPAHRLLALHKRYVFFLSPDRSGKFAHLRSGSDAVFSVDDHAKFIPLVPTSSSLQVELSRLDGGTIGGLRKAARGQQQK